ncbi:hypothetical protein Y032_0173g406 [Ancylostoma ceylanicum]|uniref:Uncharacterized protein n=1 Tax=Ancylostoma ceylanicum TaxID=53326 RepID=A0A016SU92_9BILA|nr:hypothetical protein Y032_0173g406 [Ancylostoma ceylanicum]
MVIRILSSTVSVDGGGLSATLRSTQRDRVALDGLNVRGKKNVEKRAPVEESGDKRTQRARILNCHRI